MKLRNLFLYFVLIVLTPCLIGQTVGSSGRVTGNLALHGSVNFTTSGLSVSCSSGCPLSSYTAGPISPSSQVAGGVITFTASHDASGTIGGASGGGAAQVQVSCNGGTTWLPFASGTATLPTLSMSWTYPVPSCTGPTNLNTLLFRITLGGGGSPSFNMTATANSQVTISW